jgi:hypothetical protein
LTRAKRAHGFDGPKGRKDMHNGLKDMHNNAGGFPMVG